MHSIRRHQLIALAALLMPSLLHAQSAASPIRNSLFVALGGDFGLLDPAERPPLFVSAGVERARRGSRWTLRLGADYRRVTSRYSEVRWDDFGVALSARYGRRSGALRPYLLGGVGIADLRMRSRWGKYDDVAGTFYGPIDSTFTSTSRWNGLITSGFGTDVSLGRVRLFTEARFNLYPARLSDRARNRSMETSKALYFGIKF